MLVRQVEVPPRSEKEGVADGVILGWICKLSNCWDGSAGALIVRVPAVISLPVLVSQGRQEIILYRQRRDLGMTAAIVATIAVAAAATAVAEVAISHLAVTADTVDQLSERVSEALQTEYSGLSY